MNRTALLGGITAFLHIQAMNFCLLLYFEATTVIAIHDRMNPLNLKKADRENCRSSSGVLNEE